VARQFIGIENCAVVLATILCYWLLSKEEQQQQHNNSFDSKTDATMVGQQPSSEWDGIPTDPTSIVLLIGIHLLGAIASLLDSGFTVAVERDWIVVMSLSAAHNSTGTTNTDSDEEEEEHVIAAQKLWLCALSSNVKFHFFCPLVSRAVISTPR
jgi:hypothetical protein